MLLRTLNPDTRSWSHRGGGGGRTAVGNIWGLIIAAVMMLSLSGAAAFANSGPQATTAPADPNVGPLFHHGVTNGHQCTASVLSAGQNLLLTAAHCLSGTGKGMQFVPGYDGTSAHPSPFGVWNVTRTWVPAGWVKTQNPQEDYAVLKVADLELPGRSEKIHEVAPGNSVSLGVPVRGRVTVTAYNAGSADAPISCTTDDAVDQSLPTFNCGGYVGGTSGAPWLETSGPAGERVVVGVIGGLHQGGCSDAVSYSPKFDFDLYLLLIRAALELPGDDVPRAAADGC